jgi:pectate lyase
MKKSALILALAAVSSLTACGGGGSGGSKSSAAALSSVAPSSQAPSSQAASSLDASSIATTSVAASSVAPSSVVASSEVASSVAPSSMAASSADPVEACTSVNTVQGFASMGNGTTGGADVGAGNNTISVTTGVALNAALSTSSIYKDKPLVVYIDAPITWANSNNLGIKLQRNNVSIIGRTNAEFSGVGIGLSDGASNIIIRNLLMHEVPQANGAGDHINLDGRNAALSNIWIDHNEFYNDLTVDKDFYDELVSGRSAVHNVTISYNYLHDSQKTSLWGSSDDAAAEDVGRTISYHHNYWKDVNSRLPLFRFGEGHVWNNYYSGITGSGINSRMGAKMRIDNNVFENSKNPILSADSAAIGYWNASGNIFTNVTWAGSFNAACSTAPCYAGGNNSTGDYVPPYSYTATDASEVKAEVMANAGRNKIDACLGLNTSSSSSVVSSSASSSSGPANISWNSYSGELHPTATGSISLAGGTMGEFALSNGSPAEADFFSAADGQLTFDSTAAAGDKLYAQFNRTLPASISYPRNFTLLAGVTGNGTNRALEIDTVLGDGSSSSRIKMLLRADGSNQGVQLEKIDGSTSKQSYDSAAPFNDFRIYQVAVSLTSATSGSVKVYAQGSDEVLIEYEGSLLAGGSSDNYVRIGDGGSSAYFAKVDWLLWTDDGAYAPSQLLGKLPSNIGVITGY